MAKFRQGDLVLQSTQKIWQGGVEILKETGEANLFSLKFTSGVRVYGFDSDGTLSADSDTRVATQKAVKTYVDSQVAGSIPPGTDESIMRYNGTSAIQESSVFIDDDGNISGINNLMTSGDTTCTNLVVTGDISCNDLQVSASSIYVGMGQIKSTAGTIDLYYDDEKRVSTIDEGVSVEGPSDEATYGGTIVLSHSALGPTSGTSGTSQRDFYLRNEGHMLRLTDEYDTNFINIPGYQSTTQRIEICYNSQPVMRTNYRGMDVIHGSNWNGDDPTLTFYEKASGVATYVGRIAYDSDGRMNIETVSGSLGRITMKTGADIIMQGLENGATELYYNGSKVAETTATGITGAVWG